MVRQVSPTKLALHSLLQYIRNNPDEVFSVGQISLWLRGGSSLERVEGLLESLVAEGILRVATREELDVSGQHHGYKLIEDAFPRLPPEDHTYGSVD